MTNILMKEIKENKAFFESMLISKNAVFMRIDKTGIRFQSYGTADEILLESFISADECEKYELDTSRMLMVNMETLVKFIKSSRKGDHLSIRKEGSVLIFSIISETSSRKATFKIPIKTAMEKAKVFRFMDLYGAKFHSGVKLTRQRLLRLFDPVKSLGGYIRPVITKNKITLTNLATTGEEQSESSLILDESERNSFYLLKNTDSISKETECVIDTALMKKAVQVIRGKVIHLDFIQEGPTRLVVGDEDKFVAIVLPANILNKDNIEVNV